MLIPFLRRAMPVVLVVDADAIQRERVRKILIGLLPCTILEAADTETALAHIRAVGVDLVLLARSAPRPGERAFIATIHTDPLLGRLAVILLSTVYPPADQTALSTAGRAGSVVNSYAQDT